MFAKCMYFEIYSIYTVHTEHKYYNMQKFMGDMSLLSLAECPCNMGRISSAT